MQNLLHSGNHPALYWQRTDENVKACAQTFIATALLIIVQICKQPKCIFGNEYINCGIARHKNIIHIKNNV